MGQLSYRTLRENVEAALRMKILSRELAPGTRVVEQNLSKEFGVSRGPIREALRQLEHEGLVEYVRNAGCSVKKITAEDLYELYLMRSSYEILSVELCG
ncbi:MAG: GntR family transcriptional regulator, partial [Oscillospiraceae bacterium]|nr:GntR family transcriptional regulator [Oscillospiraceae bacterium]